MALHAPMPIPAVTRLLQECYEEAEAATRESLETDFLDKGEVFITELFHGRLRAAAREANAKDRLKRAFVEDLSSTFPELRNSGELEGIASGIRATATLHHGSLETHTGGDLGIVFVRPCVSGNSHAGVLKVCRDHRRGLLCQAKMKQRSSQGRKERWRALTDNQRLVLPEQLEYLSLLLYEYQDNDRDALAPFQWQLCSESTIGDVEDWLASGSFPAILNTSSLIGGLAQDRIGTDDRDAIERYIGPGVRPSLIVEIGWPPGKGPQGEVWVHRQPKQTTRQEIRVVM